MDSVLPGIRAIEKEMIDFRHDLHAHPELAYEEHRTSELVATLLRDWGYEVHVGLGGTGIVASMKVGNGTKTIALRAEMDALPIQEKTGLGYASVFGGKMHACGHDGHTAILTAAAKHLASTRSFSGTLRLVFQPAEEGLGGGRRMIEEGLFSLFPCDCIFALHNLPGYPTGKFGFLPGPFMASSDSVILQIQGNGGHASAPHLSIDPVVCAAQLILALQVIVSRNVDPRSMAVISVGAINGGKAANVIPESVEMKLSVRAGTPETREILRKRITETVHAHSMSSGASIEIDYQWRYPSLINHEKETAFAAQVARDWLGEAGLIQNMRPLTPAEDFSFMLEKCPGCYFIVGNGEDSESPQGGCMVHNPMYDFNDAVLPLAATYWVKLVERYLC